MADTKQVSGEMLSYAIEKILEITDSKLIEDDLNSYIFITTDDIDQICGTTISSMIGGSY